MRNWMVVLCFFITMLAHGGEKAHNTVSAIIEGMFDGSTQVELLKRLSRLKAQLLREGQFHNFTETYTQAHLLVSKTDTLRDIQGRLCGMARQKIPISFVLLGQWLQDVQEALDAAQKLNSQKAPLIITMKNIIWHDYHEQILKEINEIIGDIGKANLQALCDRLTRLRDSYEKIADETLKEKIHYLGDLLAKMRLLYNIENTAKGMSQRDDRLSAVLIEKWIEVIGDALEITTKKDLQLDAVRAEIHRIQQIIFKLLSDTESFSTDYAELILKQQAQSFSPALFKVIYALSEKLLAGALTNKTSHEQLVRIQMIHEHLKTSPDLFMRCKSQELAYFAGLHLKNSSPLQHPEQTQSAAGPAHLANLMSSMHL